MRACTTKTDRDWHHLRLCRGPRRQEHGLLLRAEAVAVEHGVRPGIRSAGAEAMAHASQHGGELVNEVMRE